MDCVRLPKSFDFGMALLNYDDITENAMIKIKYKNRREYIEPFAMMMAERFRGKIEKMQIDCLMPVPVHKSRLRERGFNQAEILANILGNLVSRTVSMTNKYFDGVLVNAKVEGEEGFDQDLKETVLCAVNATQKKMEKLRVADAITEIWNIFKRCNKYIDETCPWILAKDEEKKGRLQTVLYHLSEAIVIGTSLLESFMPETAEKILEQLGTGKRAFEDMDKFGLLCDGTKVVEKPEILFARLDLQEVLDKVAKIMPKPKKEEVVGMDVEAKEKISFDDFMKLQIQLGKIIECEAVPKSKKLLCSKVQIGSQIRQIVSGIKNWYTPEEMVGKTVTVLVNLEPKKIAGVMSEGMILCAEDNEGNLSLVTSEKTLKPGAEIR